MNNDNIERATRFLQNAPGDMGAVASGSWTPSDADRGIFLWWWCDLSRMLGLESIGPTRA